MGIIEKGEREGIPEGGDELIRYESNPKASRTLSHKMTEGEFLLSKANDTHELWPKIGGGRALGDRNAYMITFDGPNYTPT